MLKYSYVNKKEPNFVFKKNKCFKLNDEGKITNDEYSKSVCLSHFIRKNFDKLRDNTSKLILTSCDKRSVERIPTVKSCHINEKDMTNDDKNSCRKSRKDVVIAIKSILRKVNMGYDDLNKRLKSSAMYNKLKETSKNAKLKELYKFSNETKNQMHLVELVNQIKPNVNLSGIKNDYKKDKLFHVKKIKEKDKLLQ